MTVTLSPSFRTPMILLSFSSPLFRIMTSDAVTVAAAAGTASIHAAIRTAASAASLPDLLRPCLLLFIFTSHAFTSHAGVLCENYRCRTRLMQGPKVISRIVPHSVLPQSAPSFGIRGAPVSSTDSVVAERVPKGTQQPAPSSCRGGSKTLSPTGRRACRGRRAFDLDIILYHLMSIL